MRKCWCEMCADREAEWAMQYVADTRPSFSRLGSHYRGFPVTAVCEECKELRIREERQT